MSHIIFIKTSSFFSKTHFFIIKLLTYKLSGATLGSHQDKQPAGSPLLHVQQEGKQRISTPPEAVIQNPVQV